MKKNHSLFQNIKNKEIKITNVVPLIALQNSEKINFINILYYIKNNINIELTANKFINILRYNPKIKEPKFFHLEVKFKNNHFLFYKDAKYKEIAGLQNIINENKRINKNLEQEKSMKYKDHFYMTEINSISFIKQKKYFLEHDLCDFPLLSKNKIINEINTEDKNETENNIQNKDNNIFNREILEIMKNNIEHFIIILDTNNYKDEINYKIISQLKDIINKPIINSLILFDISSMSKNVSEEYTNFCNYLVQRFPDFKVFNYCLNKNLAISLNQLESELLMEKSFYHFLRYNIFMYNSQNFPKEGESRIIESFTDKFINYLETLIDIENNKLDDELENISDEENKKIDNTILKLKEKDKVNLIIANRDDENKNILRGDSEDEDFSNKEILQMAYIYFKQKKYKIKYSDIESRFIDYFKNHNEYQKQFLEIAQFDCGMNEIDEKDQNIIDNLSHIIDILENSKSLKNKIKNTIKNFKSDIELLKEQNQNLIYIPFLGPSNSGKSTILNAIIGKNVLPIELGECTKKGIIISYSGENEPDISIRNAKLVSKKNNGKTKYYFKYEKNIIASGFSKVKEILKSLNYRFAEEEENQFYYVRTKIKLFDDMKLNNYLKMKIFLIDFPGYGPNNNFEDTIFPKIYEFSNCFSFTVRNSLIKEIENYSILNNALETIKKTHKKFSANGFIKSCFFICNICDGEQNDTDDDLSAVKNDIQELTKVANKNDINACFLKALNYFNYINNLEFFFNIKETINREYIKYNEKKFYYHNILFKNSSFEEYLDEAITKKLAEIGLNYIPNDEVSSSSIKYIKEEIDSFPLEKFSEKIKDDICKKLCFAQKNMKVKYNNEKYEKGFKKLIENAFNEMIRNKKEIINNQIYILEKIIEQKYSEEIDYIVFEILKEKGKLLIDKMEDLLLKFKNKADKKWDICSEYLTNIIDYLINIKKNKKEFLKKKDLKNIKIEIKNDLENYIKGLSLSIKKYIIEIDNETLNLIIEGKGFWNRDMVPFEEFIILRVSQKGINISEELMNEINKCFEDTISLIWKNKSIKSLIESILFDADYLSNYIDLLNESLKIKLEHFLHLIFEYFQEFNNQLIREIEEKIESIETKFIKFEPKELEKFQNVCKIKINNIKNIINKYLNEIMLN